MELNSKKNISVNFLSQQPIEIAQNILYKVPTDEIMAMCNISKHFKYKICNDYFWKTYIDKKWKNKDEALVNAYTDNKSYIVEVLLQDSRVDPSADKNKAIIKASSKGYYKIVKLLLKDSRVDPSADNNYAIGQALYYGHLQAINKLLKDSRFKFSTENYHYISYALEQKLQFDAVKLVLIYILQKENVLEDLLSTKDIIYDIVDLLIKNNINIDSYDDNSDDNSEHFEL